MLLHINHHSGIPIYRQVMDQIRYQILSGVIEESEQLPSVRDLSSQIKVNPMTISKAYAFLEMEGLLDRRRGVGLFAAGLTKSTKKTNSSALVTDKLEKVANDAISLGLNREQFTQIANDVFNDLEAKNNK
ncbi:MAG: GntR family transcriptional regulator [Sedimentisphaerales bacterium]|nr:GntR family transcriptional regulator [Sedimentisphaerales bacterium]